VTALATFAVALRAALTTDDGVKAITSASDLEESSSLAYQQAHQQLLRVQVDGANDYEFIIAYLVELALTYVVYYPIVGTIFFSGILTCGRYPLWGGRPYEIQEALQAELEEELDEEQYDFDEQQCEIEIMAEIEVIINQIVEKDLALVVVSNEVGQGVVPAYQSGRVYRDIVGRANQLIATRADEVYITYAGLPVEIKELGQATKDKFKSR
jgi:hypothetical protein